MATAPREVISLKQLDTTTPATPAPIQSQSGLTEWTHTDHFRPDQEVVTVAISALQMGESPRTKGQDQEHIIRLAEMEGPLPPIIVNRRTMQVVDGVHRVFATILRGEDRIRAVFFDGSAEDAFLCAVQANIAHGLPLSLADRRAAAERIILSHSLISDRAIARAAGLGAKTVAALRRRLALSAPQVQTRVGIDGKARPLNSAAGRLRAAQVLAERPHASLREVARLAGVSPTTVSDVKRRLAVGNPPAGALPPAPEANTDARPVREEGTRQRSAPETDSHVRPAPDETAQPRSQRRAVPAQLDPGHALEKLLRDPSLRQKQLGRELLRLLHHNAIVVKEWRKLMAAVPQHCTRTTADLARQYAESWEKFEEKVRATD
ncbi:ParB N-terminal domain-containing protein [Streptomyces sp. NPDC050528]|uniref:ParB N-terminal domain-containing protein n=1 Tax=unclassified Streptomyces TaxID=2593676 RepID=UPI0037948603